MMPAEFDFIEWIKGQQRPAGGVVTSIGDDMAVLRWQSDDLLLVGVDQVLDGVHFDSSVHSPRAIGRKAMNRNLSDCAAMACLPAAAVTTFALPNHVGIDYAKEIFLGLKEAGDVFNCPIVGGDTGSWSGKLVVTVSILGRANKVMPVTRRGAKHGDSIYVTGPLGGSILGRHMTFIPKIVFARALAAGYPISAMIDLSDGLSRDLRHIVRESDVGAALDAASIPVHADAIEMRRDGHSPLEHALHDGEDYELLFTSAANIPPELGIRVGTITTDVAAGQVMLVKSGGSREPLIPKGWEHQL
jgi:thiamine-monophosphate kinase